MKNNDDIPTTDTNEIKQLLNRVKRGELDQGDALLIEKLLNILLMIVSLLQRNPAALRLGNSANFSLHNRGVISRWMQFTADAGAAWGWVYCKSLRQRLLRSRSYWAGLCRCSASPGIRPPKT